MVNNKESRFIQAITLGFVVLLVGACAPVGQNAPSFTTTPLTTSLVVTFDGATREFDSVAETVGQALETAGIEVNPADEIIPPPATALDQSGDDAPFTITIVRVTETSENIPESIPFKRRIVRSADMLPEDPPRLLQTGEPGYQEVTVRIVYRDGLEAERWPTSVTVIEPAKDEIIMLGVGSGGDAMPILGRLAYIDGGRAILVTGSTDSPRQITIDGPLDGRVFQLSPDGRYLLFTVGSTDSQQESFTNQLWITATADGAQPQPLQIENVLWAGWDPAALEFPRIAYTTARSTALPPGWEAINDLWLLTIPLNGAQAAPVRVVGTYPATLGWWGGNYAWAPDGSRLAYAFADEIGLIEIPGTNDLPEVQDLNALEPERTILHTFDVYDTGADWAWVPNLSWSADSRYLAFGAYDAEADRFDLLSGDTSTQEKAVLVSGAGIWSATQWSPPSLPESHLSSLRAIDSEESNDSTYALWVAEADGSNDRRIFPPEGERGRFARSNQSLVWGPDGNAIAFIFEDALHIASITTGEVYRAPSDDTVSSHPTWAPYGAAAGR